MTIDESENVKKDLTWELTITHSYKTLIISLLLNIIIYKLYIRVFTANNFDEFGLSIIKLIINEPRNLVFVINFFIIYYCIKLINDDSMKINSIKKLDNIIKDIGFNEATDVHSLITINENINKIIYETTNDYIDEKISTEEFIIFINFLLLINNTTMTFILSIFDNKNNNKGEEE